MAAKFRTSLHAPSLVGQSLPVASGASLEAAFLKTIFAEIAGTPIRAADKAADSEAARGKMNALPSSASTATSKGGTG